MELLLILHHQAAEVLERHCTRVNARTFELEIAVLEVVTDRLVRRRTETLDRIFGRIICLDGLETSIGFQDHEDRASSDRRVVSRLNPLAHLYLPFLVLKSERAETKDGHQVHVDACDHSTRQNHVENIRTDPLFFVEIASLRTEV